MYIQEKYSNEKINLEIISELKHENKYLREVLEEEKRKDDGYGNLLEKDNGKD